MIVNGTTSLEVFPHASKKTMMYHDGGDGVYEDALMITKMMAMTIINLTGS